MKLENEYLGGGKIFFFDCNELESMWLHPQFRERFRMTKKLNALNNEITRLLQVTLLHLINNLYQRQII
jgi:hypothetical protein